MQSTPRIILQPQNPLDLRPEKLADLREQLTREGFVVEIGYEDQTGLGVTFWEVLVIWVGKEIIDASVDAVAQHVINWASMRFKSGSHRPVALTIVDENGNVLREVRCDPKEQTAPVIESGRHSSGRRLPPLRSWHERPKPWIRSARSWRARVWRWVKWKLGRH
jgi:hypothetical protein